MARLISSPTVLRGEWPLCSRAGETKMQRGWLALDDTALVQNDVLEAVVLPANHIPVDAVIDCEILDDNAEPALTFDIGLIAGKIGDAVLANRSVGIEFEQAETIGQTGGVLRAPKWNLARITPQPVDRAIGLRVATGPTSPVVRTGTFTRNRGMWQPGEAYAVGDYLILPNGVWMQCTVAGVSGLYGLGEADRPRQNQPNWAFERSFTVADGSVTWTCRSPSLRMVLLYRSAPL